MFRAEAVNQDMAQDLRDHARRYVFLGILSVVVGAIGIVYAGMVTLTSVIVFGALLIVAGVSQILHALQWRNSLSLSVHVPIGILDFVVGAVMLSHPVATIFGLTLLLAAFFVVSGVYRVIVAASVRFPTWGWQVASGIVSIVLGALVWREWPASSLWLLGTFVSLYCVVNGWAFLMLGVVAGSLAPPRRPQPAT